MTHSSPVSLYWRLPAIERCETIRLCRVKSGVLTRLAASALEFEAVPDLCEMSARRDPRLAELASADGLRIAACFPRAVHGRNRRRS